MNENGYSTKEIRVRAVQAVERGLTVESTSTAFGIARRTLHRWLARFRAEGANGCEALEVAGDKPLDLVITDLNMPEMDGITLIRDLRAKPTYKFTPILLLTTESQDTKKQEGKAAGATGWMVKPFNTDQLLTVVRKVVK